VTRIKYREDTLGWRGQAHTHIFTVAALGGEPRQLMDGDWDDRGPVWSLDGRSIAFISHHRDDRDLVPFNEAYADSADGGEPDLRSAGLWEVAAITWSPDGERLAVVGTDDAILGASWQGAVFVLEHEKRPRRITPDEVKPAGGMPPMVRPPELRWTDDGRLLFIGDERGESFLYQADIEKGGLLRVGEGSVQLQSVSFDRPGGSAVLLAASPGSAGEPPRRRGRRWRRHAADVGQRGLLRYAPARCDGEVHDHEGGNGRRVPHAIPARVRQVAALPADRRRPRRAAWRVLRRVQSHPAGARHGRLPRAVG
jgi:dipeptidyl aminopeptidase/acylaminoacyl peptidase